MNKVLRFGTYLVGMLTLGLAFACLWAVLAGLLGPAPLALTAAIHFACEPLFGGCSLTSVFLRTHPLLTPLVSQPCSDNSPALALRVPR